MGLMKGEFPPVEAAKFRDMPYLERIRLLCTHWGEYGFGTPKIIPVIYLVKLLLFFVLGGVTVVTLSSGLDPFNPAAWWDQPLVWQKLVLWTVLLESLGVAGSWGPLAGHFKPMTAGCRHYARLGTIRLPPWPDNVPLTKGDGRTLFDVGLYVALITGLVVAIVSPGVEDAGLTAAVGPGNAGLVAAGAIIPIIVLLLVLGLRDKIFFLAARGEQYVPALTFFAFFPFVDMIVAAKILIVVVWCGSAFSKFGRHFAHVIPPMVSNTPWLLIKAIKRSLYRDFPEDLRPSEGAVRLAHAGGTFVELVTPLVLLFSADPTIATIGVVLMLAFHTFIISTFPLAVPLEWNALFMYIASFLFLGFANYQGFGLGDMDPTLLATTVVALLFFPVLGNVRPDLVSFLPSMRQYAGNWASAAWALAPGAEDKLDNGSIKKAASMQVKQLVEIGMYDPIEAEVIISKTMCWRAMHSQGRGINSVLINQLGDDLDRYYLREGEFCCNAIVGFNFGCGHLHDHRMIAAVQRRVGFEPGELIVAWVESEPVGNGRQQYMVIDAAVGIVERGSWSVSDCVVEQPWLPNGPIPTEVTYRKPGYERPVLDGGTGVSRAADQ